MSVTQAIPKKLLFLGQRSDFELVEGKMAACSPPVAVHSTRRISEALTGLRERYFDAALCAVSREEDVAQIIRMKKAGPIIPLFALVDAESSALGSLSLRMGAGGLIARDTDPKAVSSLLSLALETRALATALKATTATTSVHSHELLELSKKARILAGSALDRFQKSRAEGFLPLLVEDDLNDELLFIMALRKAGLFRKIPTVRTVDQATRYLEGDGEYADRVRYPVPNIVILDFHLGLETGEEILRFVRRSSTYRSIPVVLLSSTEDPSEIAIMEALGVNLRITKPGSIADLSRAVDVILDFWRMCSL